MNPKRWHERPLNLLRYGLARLLLRGTASRLLVMTGLVGLVALGGGLLAWWLTPDFRGPWDATWWAFLRLSDPGYLGDDEGLARRSISTVLTVLGYVIFLGAFVAIMTQWLQFSIRRLETGLTPIAARGHVVIAGWTDRTVGILREMFRTEERSRNLLGYERGRLLTVLLASDASPELHQTLRERLGEYWRERQVVLRQGEPLHLDHLERADFSHAAVILLPGDPYGAGGAVESDVRAIKAIASIGRQLQSVPRPPLLVVELFDARREPVARSMYAGHMEIVETVRLTARMLAQCIRYPGLAHAYRELLFSREGRRLRVLPVPPALVGQTWAQARLSLAEAAPLGVASRGEPRLLPPDDTVLAPADRLVVLASRDRLRVHDSVPSTPCQVPVAAPRTVRHLLVLGWTRRVPALLGELALCEGTVEGVHVLSMVPVQDRLAEMRAHGLTSIEVRHELADYTVPEVLQGVDLARFDAAVLVGTDRLESGSESDARTLAGFAALSLCEGAPRMLLELMDSENEPLLEGSAAEHIVSPMIVGRMLAQVALQPELREVCDQLFGPEGTELITVGASAYAGEGSIANRVLQAGHVPLGVVERGMWGLAPLTDDTGDDATLVCVARRS